MVALHLKTNSAVTYSGLHLQDPKNISLWEGVWSWKANTYIRAETTSYNNRFEKNISLWEGVWSCKANTFIQAGGTSYNSRFEKIFHFGRVFGPERIIHLYEQSEEATTTA